MALEDDEAAALRALRAGSEAAFTALVGAHHAIMLHVAQSHVRDRATAEDVTQDAWLGFLEAVDRFEGRSSLRTFLCAIVANKARTRAVREARSVPLSALAGEDGEPAVATDRFLPPDHERWPGHWSRPPSAFSALPEGRLLAAETRDVLLAAINALPPRQRAVILLHDVHGTPAGETCALLDLTEGNRRVLLHRARNAVRAALERYLIDRVAA